MGEAGRGFAVVADLVGQLAMRSEEEAKRAREQLTATQNDVEIAVGAVERVDGALVGISSDVSAVHEMLNGLAQDNQAQAAAVQQIASAIGTMGGALVCVTALSGTAVRLLGLPSQSHWIRDLTSRRPVMDVSVTDSPSFQSTFSWIPLPSL